MKKLAIIGKPNVGKSSFFNRLLKERDAITSDIAGTTRDVKRRVAVVVDKQVEILDTGGLDQGNELFDRIKEKSIGAAYEADIILYMVDGKSLPENDDKKFFYELQSLGKEVALVVNKIDNDKMKEKLWDFYEFGTDDIFGISVSHNRSVNELLTWIADRLPEEDRVIFEEEESDEIKEKKKNETKFQFVASNESQALEYDISDDEDYEEEDDLEDEDDSDYEEYDDGFEYDEGEDVADEEESQFPQESKLEIDQEKLKKFRVAIIGRVNVGKSSLLNALLNKERSVVSSVAGTTIDPIDEMVVYKEKEITFVDTAGIRKRGKIVGIEKFALMRTQKMLDDSDIALIVLDASEPFKDLDEKIAGLIDSNRLACLIVLNKWDIADRENYQKIIQDVRDRFKFLHYAEIITVSAMTKERIHKIYDKLLEINENYSQHIPTSQLNRVLDLAQRSHHLPSMNGQVIKIYYATQYDVRPPKVALVMNKPQGLHFSYRRYLTNKMREAFNLKGVPLLFKAKSKKQLKKS